MLFLPGNNPNMLINGNCLGADSVIFDLEDAVSPDEKDAARILVRNAISFLDLGRCEVIVRINSLDTDFWRRDLDAIVPYRPNWIMLPKTARAADVQQADEYLAQLEEKLGWERNTVRLMPLIETALGVENAFAIASAAKRVAARSIDVLALLSILLNSTIVSASCCATPTKLPSYRRKTCTPVSCKLLFSCPITH